MGHQRREKDRREDGRREEERRVGVGEWGSELYCNVNKYFGVR